jgi:heme/copper-type cytochrome/quinol oxidase subunit 4
MFMPMTDGRSSGFAFLMLTIATLVTLIIIILNNLIMLG